MVFLPTTELKPHPKNIEIYGDEDVSGLVAKIRESNWIKPLTVTQNNMIISGHRRYQACKQLGISSVPVEIRRFNNEYEELEALLLENEFREKTKEQKVKEGRTWEVLEGEKAKQRMREASHPKTDGEVASDNCRTQLDKKIEKEDIKPKNDGRTVDAVAKKVGFGSGRDYERAKKVVEVIEEKRRNGDFEKAEVLKTVLEKSTDGALKLVKENGIEKLTPERIERIKTGEASPNEVYKEIKKEERVEERKRVEQKAIATLPDISERYSLFIGDITVASEKIPAESIDVIITDPPYPQEYLPLFDKLATVAARVLKPNGSLLVMAGQSYLPEVIERLSKHLTYHWMVSYQTPGGQSAQLWQKKVNTFWKPVLWFIKGKYEGDWIGDVVKSNTNDNDKRFHCWGQSESGTAELVKRFSKAGDIVCDPFLGGGTTGYVALELNRKFIGIDIDPKSIELTKTRIQTICLK